jgi:transcriptional regulator with XRE-family HTH domain
MRTLSWASDILARMSSRSFGQIVREARLERHLSMGQLAAAVDRSTASVRRWERDDGLPTPEVIDTLVVRLGLDPDEVNDAVAATRGDEPQLEPLITAPVEAGDPIDVVPVVDVVESADAKWEQPDSVAPPPPQPVAPAAASPPLTAWPTASAPVAVVERDQNILQVLRDPGRPWLGYIRTALTLAVLGGLLWVLWWAVPEFFEAFSEMWDSLWGGSGIEGIES